jgi:glycerol uptake operon antiterminator
MTIQYALKKKPVISSIISDDDYEIILKSTSNIVFFEYGNIFTLKDLVAKFKDIGKLVFVHIDLIDGIGKDGYGIKYLADYIGVDGIVTIRSNLISMAKQSNLIAVQRCFILDSASLEKSIKVIKSSQPDVIELLPGLVIPKVFQKIRSEVAIPIIAGGLITDKFDLDVALTNGAIGVSTSSKELWKWQDENTR